MKQGWLGAMTGEYKHDLNIFNVIFAFIIHSQLITHIFKVICRRHGVRWHPKCPCNIQYSPKSTDYNRVTLIMGLYGNLYIITRVEIYSVFQWNTFPSSLHIIHIIFLLNVSIKPFFIKCIHQWALKHVSPFCTQLQNKNIRKSIVC